MTDEKTREQLDYEAGIISADILSRIAKLEGSSNGKGWLAKNWFFIVSLGVMLVGIGGAWGVVTQQQKNFEQRMTDSNQDWHQSMVTFAAELAKDEARIAKLDEDLNTHRRDAVRHVEPDWKSRIEKRLDDIHALIVDILRNTRPQRAP